jgi:hypothetical protein
MYKNNDTSIHNIAISLPGGPRTNIGRRLDNVVVAHLGFDKVKQSRASILHRFCLAQNSE